MELVTNGKKWAVKKGWWIFSRYLSLNVPGLWWSCFGSEWIQYCWGTKERAEECMEYYKHKKVK